MVVPAGADGFPAQEALFDGSNFLAPLQHRGFGLCVSVLGQAVLRAFRFERNRERKGAYSPPEPFRAPPRRSFPRAPGDDGNLQMESGASAPVGTRTFGLMRRFPGDADGFPAQEPLFDGSVFLAPLQHRGFGLWVSGLGQAVLRPFRFERNRERKGG